MASCATVHCQQHQPALTPRSCLLLVLDLSRVSSCDSAGLAVLVGAQRRARVLGIVMRLAAPSVPVAKLLRLTGLDSSLTICPDLRGALAVERHEPANPSPQVLAEGMAAGGPEVVEAAHAAG